MLDSSALLLASLAVSMGSAEEVTHPQIDTILVLNLQPSRVDEALANSLSEILVAKVRDVLPGTTVLGQSEIAAMLVAEQQKMMMGCDTDSCLAEIGGAMGADHLVTGTLGRIGNVFIVNIKLINTAKAKVVSHASREVAGGEEALIGTVAELGVELMGRFRQGSPSGGPTRGAPRVSSPADTGVTSAAGPLTPPSPEEGEEAGEPWYAKWWIWTLVGVAVAGGAATATAVALTTGGAPEDPGQTGGVVRMNLTPP